MKVFACIFLGSRHRRPVFHRPGRRLWELVDRWR